jgi:hypothetical protein
MCCKPRHGQAARADDPGVAREDLWIRAAEPEERLVRHRLAALDNLFLQKEISRVGPPVLGASLGARVLFFESEEASEARYLRTLWP